MILSLHFTLQYYQCFPKNENNARNSSYSSDREDVQERSPRGLMRLYLYVLRNSFFSGTLLFWGKVHFQNVVQEREMLTRGW